MARYKHSTIPSKGHQVNVMLSFDYPSNRRYLSAANTRETLSEVLEFLLALPVLLFSMVAHEYAHGYAALKQGDDTALLQGRLTFNPLKHIDPWMTVLMPAMLWFGSGGRFIFGGAKPIPVDPRKYRNYKRGDLIVSSAGMVANLILFCAFTVASIGVGIVGQAFDVTPPALALLQRAMFWGVWLNVLLAFFNLIPIPPLDGSHLLVHALPPRIAARYRQLGRYGMLILVAMFIWFPEVLPILLLPALVLARLSFGLVQPFALEPFMLMQG